jgi:hypothetical protein
VAPTNDIGRAVTGRLSSPFGLSTALLQAPGVLGACALIAFALAGCGSGGGPGALIVDPGHYDAYHCKDLDARAKVLATREKELRALMDKASEGGGGAVIGALSYRTDYESVLTEQKLVQREQSEKKCAQQPAGNFQSDQMIR